ncbi:immunoglobulin superfamily member 3-like [Xenopus tropicalis]|nr:immunoglobulin superfamily member 3-like [Xenopus tropicalis]
MEGGLFSLTVGQVGARDRGKYTCQATEWHIGQDSNWSRMGTRSAERELDVTPLGPSLSVGLSVRSSQVVAGSTIRLSCRVSVGTGYSLLGKPMSWSWHYRNSSDASGEFQQLVQRHYTGTMAWHDSMPGFQGKVELGISVGTSTLTVYNIERGQAGLYYCKVGILSDQSDATSNRLAIRVTVPESQIQLETAPAELLLARGQDEMSISCHAHSRVPGAQMRVTWRFLPPGGAAAQEIVSSTQEGFLTYGSELPPALRPRILSERHPPDTYTLRIIRPSQGQWGSYQCAASEWLLEGSGNWAKLGEKNSRPVPVQFRDSEETLHIPKMNTTVEVTEAEDVALHCPLGDVRSLAFRYSLSWYFMASGSGTSRLIYQAGWDGVTVSEESLAKRLRLVAPTRGNYSLILQRVGQEDAGLYHCHVEEWRLGPEEEEWRPKAADSSGFHKLKVIAPGAGLTLNSTNLTLLALQGGQNITLPCQVLSLSGTGSALSVAWWKSSGPGQQEQLLFAVSYEGQFTYPRQGELEGSQLQFERPSKLLFLLRIMQPGLGSSGTYHCRVSEWLSSPRGTPYLHTERRAGNISVTFLPDQSGSAQICTVASIFHLLLGATVLLLLLVTIMLILWGRRWGRRVGSTRVKGQKGHRGLWFFTNMADPPINGGAETEEREPMGLAQYEATTA